MENPYGWPEELKQAWAQRLQSVAVNRYPDPQGRALVAALREAMGIPDEMAVLLGNGSDEIIQIIALALALPGRSVLSVEPGFVMYRMIATFCGMDYVGVPLREDFSLDLPALMEEIGRHQPAVIFLAYPNNPTGNLFDDETLERIIRMAPGLVVIDEAYSPFTDHSYLSRLGEHPNLLVMRTLSKLGLAGLRLGYLAGPAEWLAEFHKVRLPYNINTLTQVTATFALTEGWPVLQQQTAAIRAERTRLFQALARKPGLQPYPSEANFILVRTAPGQADETFERLKTGGVLVKKLHGSHPLLRDCLRFTVGTPEENDRLLSLL
jgi:histidinol-phosphate aminotransferase